MLRALTREISPAIERCELTHLSRAAIDVAAARRQHDNYERCLAQAGCTVVRLPAGPGDPGEDEMPDSVFVEDIAVVFDELALMTRPGAASRRVEPPAIADFVGRYRLLRSIEAPGTMDGGDVLAAGKRVFAGRSTRTNDTAIDQMRRILEPCGYTVTAVGVGGCLHLKSAVTAVGDDRLLINRQWTSPDAFHGFELIDVDPSEPFAANALRVGSIIIYPDAYPRTRERLERVGLDVRTVDLSETAKAEGGVTCGSLIFAA